MADKTLGGQAVIEGVMVKSKRSMAVAVRMPNGKIAVQKIDLNPLSVRYPVFGWPFIRGMVMLFEVLVLGVKALNYSAGMASGEKEEASGWEIFITLAFSLALAIFIFKFIPFITTQFISGRLGMLQGIWFNLVEGALKVLVFVLYILAISQMQDVRTLFKYHGAEHQAISCHEAGHKLNVKNVQNYSPIHRRCGTTFLFLVIFLSIIIYSFVPSSLMTWEKFAWRILLLPVIAGISYEVLKLGAKYEDNFLVNMMVMPGLWIQKMTTSKPDNKQVEVAIKSVEAVVKMDK